MKKSSNKIYLPKSDVELFDKMKNSYTSDQERIFFEKMHYKEEVEISVSNDLLINDKDNLDHLFMYRVGYSEYFIGKFTEKLPRPRVNFDSLSAALNVNLCSCGILDRDITLLEWLRSLNYSCVKYNQNFDND